ncbi:MAG TPA: nuclear transport factor 2 family protein, partial [Rhodocyclaceae bacterium]|nr:nuclear transport factor 2 family protein [Rhodocyclaceae bacterium]
DKLKAEQASAAPAEAPAAAGPSAPAASPREIPKEAARSSTDDAARALSTRLEAWRQAWESKDAGRYLSFYGKDFAPPDGRDRGTWEAERRVRLDKKGEIHVQIVAPELRVEGDTAAVSFEQRYRAGALVDTGRKRMAWHREGGEWMIRREGMQ